ncbi:MAG: aminotransferase class I/II-fold pyridoxal phosphate-dependent enzyme, partial [Candidatus Aminicenantes bacterium]|nr:aminotransferase class I/II-fold pyridoxal phosphate-dependent enzyme [Candidatus Aminicenantes bacterium]
YVSDREIYPDGIELAVSRKNIIVLHTFSKIYSLAGLRIGYALAHEETISFLGRIKAPFNVTRPAQAAAMTSLENEDFKNESIKLNSKNKQRLFKQLQELGLRVIPSEANFLLFFPGVEIAALNEKLLQDGIIIRPLDGFGVPNGMRVTVGLAEENDYFIEKLRKNLQEMR